MAVLKTAASPLRRRLLGAGALLCAGLAARTDARAQAAASERQVKAAYLLKFSAYVDWPAGSFAAEDSPLVLALIGADDLALEVQRMAQGRITSGRPIQVRRLRHGESAAVAHMVFLGDRAAAADALPQLRAKPVLTVSDQAAVHAQGTMVNFLVADEKLRFEVNLRPAEPARLKISARMLAVAYRVVSG